MEFAREQSGDVTVVKLSGRLDSSSAQVAEQNFADVLGSGTPHLAIDLSKLQYISSVGLRVLLTVANKVQRAKGNVAVAGLNRNVREVFSISGFDKIFQIEADLAAAVAAVR